MTQVGAAATDDFTLLSDLRAVTPELGIISAEAAAWTLRYPSLYSSRSLHGTRWAEIIRLYEDGRLLEALIAFDQVPPAERNSDYQIYYAHFMLLSGSEQEAREALAPVLTQPAPSADALALKTILDIKSGHPAQAVTSARQAVAQDPGRASGHLALAFALQADRDLAGARQAAERAVAIEPDSVLGHVRLAELDLTAGRLGSARQAAERAVALAPELPDPWLVQGFVLLAQDQSESALASFQRAAKLNGSDPAGHFGLGLTHQRLNGHTPSRTRLEQSLALAPDASLSKSYLGRAYDLDGREQEAAHQFAAAMTADPRDPTPYHFDALRLASGNHPVSARARLGEALARVDYRAVYRSPELLEGDRARYLADIAGLDTILGQDERARLDATQAVAQDYTSAAAHRAAGDALSRTHRASQAAQSEYLQAMLRQPLGSLPPPLPLADLSQSAMVAPQQGFFRAATPDAVGYNEYGALFGGQGSPLDWEVTGGGRDTWGDQFRAATSVGKVGLAVNQFYFRSDGFGAWDGMDKSALRGILQYDSAPDTRLHLEYLYNDGERKGTLYPDDPILLQFQAIDEQRDRARIGLRHRLQNGDEILLLASREEMDQGIAKQPIGPLITTQRDSQAVRDANLEMQYLRSMPDGQLLAGLSHVLQRQTYGFGAAQFDFDGDGVADFISSPSTFRVSTRTLTGYLQASYRPSPTLRLEGGVAADRQRITGFDENFISPRLGLDWQAVAGGHLRLAALRGLNRFFLSGASLEPSQMLGFLTTGHETLGVRADLLGLGWDQRLSDGWGWGAEWQQRTLRYPQIGAPDPYAQTREHGERAWLEKTFAAEDDGWLPAGWEGAVNLTLDRQDYSRHELPFNSEEILDYTPWHLRLAGRLFNTSGPSLELGVTWVRGEGLRTDVFGSRTPFADNFPVVDTALNWKLPKRRGQFTLGAMNLFDERFRYLEMDASNPRFAPERYIYARLLLTL